MAGGKWTNLAGKAVMLAAACLLLGLAMAAGAAAPAISSRGVLIWIDLDQKRLTVYENGAAAAAFPIASGARETPSPLGVFRVSSRFTTEMSGFGTRFLGLGVPWGSYGIHGTNRPESIGRNASHGCIRLSVKDAETLYAMIPGGAPVVLEGGPYGPLGWGLRTLREGDRGADVRQLQLRLIQGGYLSSSADGAFGSATRRAVMAARKALGLPPGDAADERLQTRLGMILFE